MTRSKFKMLENSEQASLAIKSFSALETSFTTAEEYALSLERTAEALAAITVEDTTVRFTASLPENASFAGQLSADSTSLSGTATNPAGDAPFQLARNGQSLAPAARQC